MTHLPASGRAAARLRMQTSLHARERSPGLHAVPYGIHTHSAVWHTHTHIPSASPPCPSPLWQRGGSAAVDAVQFATVDGFQGREADVVIFSCVR